MTTTSEPITAAQEPRTTRVGARWRIVIALVRLVQSGSLHLYGSRHCQHGK